MTKNEQTIKQKTAELDKIIEWFDSGSFEVEQAITKYEAAKKIVAEIEQKLTETKLKIEELS